MLGGDTFLLNPRNREFIEGRTRRPIIATSMPGCVVLFLVPFLLAGALTFWLTLDAWYRVAGFAVAARTAEATVVAKGVEPDSEGDDDPYLDYRYSAEQNGTLTRHAGRAYVSWSDYQEYEPEDTLTIEYIAYSPGISRPANAAQGLGEAGFLTVFTLFWNGVTIPTFVFMLRNKIAVARLGRDGTLLRGVVTAYKTSTDSDNDLWVELTYSFLTPQGQQLSGVAKNINNALRTTPAPPPGTPVAVLYLNAKTHTLL